MTQKSNMNKTELIEKGRRIHRHEQGRRYPRGRGGVRSHRGRAHSGDTVSVAGFGTFSVSARAARSGRNPRTGETIAIPASKSPKFKAGKGLKDAVN